VFAIIPLAAYLLGVLAVFALYAAAVILIAILRPIFRAIDLRIWGPDPLSVISAGVPYGARQELLARARRHWIAIKPLHAKHRAILSPAAYEIYIARAYDNWANHLYNSLIEIDSRALDHTSPAEILKMLHVLCPRAERGAPRLGRPARGTIAPPPA
jgi:hypothetical protein